MVAKTAKISLASGGTVPSVGAKSRNVKTRSSTAPISAAGRSGRSFIVFLRKPTRLTLSHPDR
jgi:hypothetical protein